MWAVPPPSSIRVFVSSSFSGVRATSSTMPPASAIFIAAERPIPDEAPVTMTTRPRTDCSSDGAPRSRRSARVSSSGICSPTSWLRPPTTPARPRTAPTSVWSR